MKIPGLIVIILGGILSYGAKKWIQLVRKTDDVSEQEVLNTKLVGLLLAALGLILVFIG